jgi:hypothetical protein
MATTKYIVNNLSGQTITGDLTIQGSLVVTGTSTSSNAIAKYSALLTQTGSIIGTSLGDFNQGLIIGETYTITTFETGDDFSNIADVQSGIINETGCVFIATGETPTAWSRDSQLTSLGELIVDVLENDLGFDISWEQNPFGGSGYYIGVNSSLGPIINQFPRNRTKITSEIKEPFNSSSFPFLIPIVASLEGGAKDCAVFIEVLDGDAYTDNLLYYTPIDISIKIDFDTTPIQVYGENISGFPYGDISVTLYAGNTEVLTFSNNTYAGVNTIAELVAELNSDSNTNFLGTYSVNENVEDGVILTMATNLKNQFSPNNTLTFEVFNNSPAVKK